MSKYKKELDCLYKDSSNQNKVLLEKRAVNILIKELATRYPKGKEAPDDMLAREAMCLNNTLNQHQLCILGLIPKDSFLDYLLYIADSMNFESMKKHLTIEKARRNLLEANDNYSWVDDCEVTEEEFIE